MPRPGTRRSWARCRRCWSRGPAAPIRPCCAAARAAGRRSTSPARRRPGRSSTSRSPGRRRRRSPGARPPPSPPPDGMPVIAVFGPTASGKSAVALELAELAGGEIVSADAMQLYRGLPILTNQPSATDMERVPHHLVGIWEPDHEGSVAEYAELAHAAIDDIIRRGRVPIACGGSGLYLRAALADMPLPPQAQAGVRAAAERLYDERGPAGAHATLAAVDAPAAAAVHPNDRRRVVRALELAESGHTL